MAENKKKIIVAAIVLVMFLFGLYFVREAGAYFDEASEEKILYNNILQYSDSFHIKKVSGWLRKQGAIPICEDIEKDHGIAPYYLCGPLMLMTLNKPDVHSQIWHLYTYCLFFCGVIWMYRLLCEIFHSRITALTGAMLLFFTPKIFADGLYNNKDTVLLSMVIIMFFYGIRFLDRRDIPSAWKFGLAAGLACNLRVSGIYVFAMIGGYYLLLLSFKKQWSKKNFCAGAMAAGTGACCYIALTPAIWGQGFHLISFLKWNLSNTTNFSRMNGRVLFENIFYQYPDTPLPWYYVPKLIILTIPVYILVLIVVSLLVWCKKCKKGGWPEQLFPLFTLTAAIPIIMAATSTPNLYNGWRHLYFIYGPMIFMASYAVHCGILVWRGKGKKITMAILFVLILGDVLGIARYGIGSVAYTNLLTRGDAGGRYELDYYGVTSQKVLQSLADRYGRINIFSDSKGAVIINWAVLPSKYQEQIRILYTEDDVETARTLGEPIFGFVNTSYDVVDDENVNWLENWTAWGNTYVRIRQFY